MLLFIVDWNYTTSITLRFFLTARSRKVKNEIKKHTSYSNCYRCYCDFHTYLCFVFKSKSVSVCKKYDRARCIIIFMIFFAVYTPFKKIYTNFMVLFSKISKNIEMSPQKSLIWMTKNDRAWIQFKRHKHTLHVYDLTGMFWLRCFKSTKTALHRTDIRQK